MMLGLKTLLSFIVLVIKVPIGDGIMWERIRCSVDADETISDGTVADNGRFPWLGVVQHSFYVGGRSSIAITSAVLIHPAYAIAPADDIAKILHEQLKNNTRFIMWYSGTIKYAVGVRDYILHPEYEEQRTLATIAVLELITFGETGIGDNPSTAFMLLASGGMWLPPCGSVVHSILTLASDPVLPICMPLKGAGSLTDIYAAKMTDENKDIQKEVFKMNLVHNRDCEEFYYNHKLNFEKMAPSLPTCAIVERPMEACIWDGGVALITRQSWGYWALLGFSVRGPGCGAPARFLSIRDYLPWINDMISPQPIDEEIPMHRIGVRQLSPIKIILYEANTLLPKGVGQCEKETRGTVQYKDAFEVLMTKNFGQGFFFVSVDQIASFTCAIVNMEEVTAKSNTAIWIEHYCHREIMGIAFGQEKPRDYRKSQCFLYFKSAAYVEFRFYFSFKAVVELTLFGYAESQRRVPNPFVTDETTVTWWPTDRLIRWSHFGPYYLWWWDL